MSLDIDLTREKCVSYDKGETYNVEEESVYSTNITHNLAKMAAEAGVYKALWRPEEIGKTKAGELVDLLENGLNDLKSRPQYFEKFNPKNGWGTYESLLAFVEEYLKACKTYREAIIIISR